MRNFYDTNAILNLQDKIFDKEFVISSATLQEIEHIKTSAIKSEEVKFKARKVAKLLDKNIDKYEVYVVKNSLLEIIDDFGLETSPDNLIIASAYLCNLITPITFVSDDICCKLIAREVFGLTVCGIDGLVHNEEYLGYKEITLNDEEMAYFYEHLNENTYKCLINEYLIISNTIDGVVDKLKWDGEKYVSLKVGKIRDFKPMNIQQELAFDLMASDTPIKIILGNAGSGKTLINLKFALQGVSKGKFARILYLREMIGKGSQIGYLKGTKMEKMMPFLAGVVDNLDMGEFELQKMISEGTLVVDTPYFLKGASKENTWFLVDEAEDLDVEMIKLIGTRLNKESCICLSGDLDQTENKYKSNNGLNAFINKFKGNELVGIIKLKEDVRSDASRLFNKL